MHTILAVLRLIHRKLYELGPGILPVVLSKYRTQCAIAIGILCLALAAYDISRRRRVEGSLWALSWVLLFAGFRSDAMLWGPQTTVALGTLAIAAAAGAFAMSLARYLREALDESRRERMHMRRVPGAPLKDRGDRPHTR